MNPAATANHRPLRCVALFVTTLLASGTATVAAPDFGRDYDRQIRPLIELYCLKCHSTEKKKGKLDLERFTSIALVREDLAHWRLVVEQLEAGEMPPAEQPRPSAAEKKQLINWTKRLLVAEVKASAGDPGRVVLRRLSNAELNYTIRDLTGVDLRPAREFPVDGAAGEGFSNIGQALVMSPVLLPKYLDAAKGVAAHAVLLPEGFRFAAQATRRDWTDEAVKRVKSFYALFANKNGRVDLRPYFEAILEHRQALTSGQLTPEAVVNQAGLNAKYFGIVWRALTDPSPSPLLDGLLARWRAATKADAPALVADIAAWQGQLWKSNNVGHFKPWQQPVDPLVTVQPLRRKLEAVMNQSDLQLHLVVRDASDGHDGAAALWLRPRFEVAGRPPLLLRDLRPLTQILEVKLRQTLARTEDYLDAAAEIHGGGGAVTADQLAGQRGLDAAMLQQWLNYLGFETPATLVQNHLRDKLNSAAGYDFVKGWGRNETPLVVANASDQTVKIPGTMPPHSFAMHPSPSAVVAVGWRSPVAGRMRLEARVADAHAGCGNGVAWSLQLRRGNGRRELAAGAFDDGKQATIAPIEKLDLRVGDFISLVVDPRGTDHGCDLTAVDLTLTELDGDRRRWNLAEDVSSNLLDGNPHADRLGNAEVWHFYEASPNEMRFGVPQLPEGSALALWRDAVTNPERAGERKALAARVAKVAAGAAPSGNDSDARLHRELTSLGGPLVQGLDFQRLLATEKNLVAATNDPYGLVPSAFGHDAQGRAVDEASLAVQAPSVMALRLPAALLAGSEFVVDGKLDAPAGGGGSVQFEILTAAPAKGPGLSAGLPIVVAADGAAHDHWQRAFAGFRQTFPAAVCYPRVVPVDEVVTLVLFHREDDPLVHNFLDNAQAQELDRLWSELRFISQDALSIEQTYPQFMGFVSQDGDTNLFNPLREPIRKTADEFRARLLAAEPRQFDALLDFAARAWRRPLTPPEQAGLGNLYRAVRDLKLSHDEAFRATLAAVLVSPNFLYKVETPGAGALARTVSDFELATRLSYFFWSSLPDAELRAAATAGRLHKPTVFTTETRRMLQDPRIRALAIEFAGQWLGFRGFDEQREKNEKLFPTFDDALRHDLYEESIRFFEDLFQHDGSVLSILDADYTFLNENLAKHYGVPGITGEAWRRVDHVQSYGRGGVLGMGSVLTKQSGASRTSPILRGIYVVETLLGEPLPKPPPNVPQLPEAETDTADLTVRQLVEKHRSNPACAVCHDKFDAYGFVLEAFDPIGRFRERDLAGRPVDIHATLPDGAAIAGLPGLREHLVTAQRQQFLRTFCRKLLGYGLGRSVALSDEPLIEKMMADLKRNQYRFSSGVLDVVDSEQFRRHRGLEVAETIH